LHGIWSWVSEDNRQIILDFIDRKLKPGGVLYLSYNTQPGWSAFMPLRDCWCSTRNWPATRSAACLPPPASKPRWPLPRVSSRPIRCMRRRTLHA
jgi:hypothetical protein